MPTIVNINEIKNSKVLLRADFDVPIIKNIIQSTYRIDRCLETIKLLIQNNNKVILFTKVGRPEGFDENLSTKHFINYLNNKLNLSVEFENNVDKISHCFLKSNFTIFENTRFYPWEDTPDDEFSRRMANFFDYYVDEAFAVSHRKETSNYYIPSKINNLALGINYQKEISFLDRIKNKDFENPAIFILGGAKAETKIPMINKIKNNFNYIIVGGKLIDEPNLIELKQNVKNLILLTNEKHGFDINNKSIDVIINAIKLAKTIVWNGPLGKFEEDIYKNSTVQVLNAFKNKQNGLKISGGGDTISAIEKYGDFNDFSFVSTGGGAMFSYLTGEKTNIENLI